MVIEEPGLQPGHLANHLQLQPSTITRLIEKLESRKLVIRTTEGKVTNVYATPRGKDMLPKLKECLQDFYQHYVSILGKDESAKLVQNMIRVTDKLDL